MNRPLALQPTGHDFGASSLGRPQARPAKVALVLSSRPRRTATPTRIVGTHGRPWKAPPHMSCLSTEDDAAFVDPKPQPPAGSGGICCAFRPPFKRS